MKNKRNIYYNSNYFIINKLKKINKIKIFKKKNKFKIKKTILF